MAKETSPSVPELYRIHDPEELARNMLKLWEETGRAMTGLIERTGTNGPFSPGAEMAETSKTMVEFVQHWMADPVRMAEAQTELANGYAELWTNQVRRMMGEDVAPVAEPQAGDNRFKDPEWSANPWFDFWKQAYLLSSRWAEEQLARTEGLDDRTRAKAEFYLKQVTSAISPSNFPFTNPEVVRETLASNGQNLVHGMEHFVQDIERSGDVIKISQTDTSAFEVGRNLAVTPGKVVFQNALFQLIQYTPTTERVRAVPLLITPPWINKYYILDLTQPKSFIRYIVDQGFTVFVISWVNPDETLAGKTFEDYMREGLLTAADVVRRETGAESINVLGYCVGGTLLATTLAWLAAGDGAQPFSSATFLTTQVDFSRAGDLSLFIDDTQLKALSEMMAEHGFLDGSRMATVFNLLRPKDLIWPYIVNNYLLGKKPFPFDLLYWNQDSTRMPAANHGFYLREFYRDNKLAQGRLVLGGRTLDMSKVQLPVFELATREDHIAPARSCYIGAQLMSGPVEFCLAGSGHIAGVVNPPDPKKIKYQYWTGPKPQRGLDLDDWMAKATEVPGSWWPHWIEWLSTYSGDWIEARTPGAALGVIEDAPGSYVKVPA